MENMDTSAPSMSCSATFQQGGQTYHVFANAALVAVAQSYDILLKLIPLIAVVILLISVMGAVVTLLVASQTETSLLDLAHGLGRAMGRPDLKPVHQAARAVNPVPRRLGSAQLAAALIGFRAQVPLDDGLRGLVDWWREEQAATLPQEATS